MMLSCISGSADFLRLRGEQPAEVGVSADTASDAKRSACRRVFLSDKTRAWRVQDDGSA